MTELVPLAELVEDMTIYPRGTVSDIRVADIVYALDAGEVLPPPIVDRATRKIVDGVHRTRAYRKRAGPDGSIEVTLQDFPDDHAMLLESGRLNHSHGLPLGRYDQRVLHIKAKALGATDEEIADALGVTVTRLLQITVMEARSDQGDVPLKRGMAHLGGQYLSQERVAEIRRARGIPGRVKVNELTRQLRQDLLPVKHDPELRAALAELDGVIQEVLAPYIGE